ncbi:MAG TPA: hypothetical protein VHP55_02170 [Usitatibacter sp.]|nr:hypothetical protein [Usitatibacter sp.]HEX3097799.1 hypothetical protein [Usitatibacter sp.]
MPIPPASSEQAIRDLAAAAAEADARIKIYVPVFARRRALERLKSGGPRF